MNHTSTSTPDTSKQKTWKARFSSGRRRHSAGGEEEAFNNYVEQQAEVQQQPTQSSLSMQRGKSKKNWKGSLRNLLPPSKKESDGGGSNPQTPDAEHADNIALDVSSHLGATREHDIIDGRGATRVHSLVYRLLRSMFAHKLCVSFSFHSPCINGRILMNKPVPER
jgi:hypothetical protein